MERLHVTRDSAAHAAAARVAPADEEHATIGRAVEHGLDALAPLVARLVADDAISAEHALHVVVMNPTVDARTAGFDDAVLVERSFGDPARWQADYAWYARAKTQVAWRERLTLRTLLARCPERLQAGDIRVEGAVREGRWIVGASGAQPWYDHAIASIAVRLFEAALTHAQATAGAAEERR